MKTIYYIVTFLTLTAKKGKTFANSLVALASPFSFIEQTPSLSAILSTSHLRVPS